MKIYWLWWIGSLGLFFLEFLMPATFFLWAAVAAIVVGFIVLFMPTLHVAYQLLAFGLLSIITLLLSKLMLKQLSAHSDEPYINQRNAEYIGKVYTLSTAIEDGSGYVQIGGTSWRVDGPDCSKGTKVKVIGVEDVYLRVEPLAEN